LEVAGAGAVLVLPLLATGAGGASNFLLPGFDNLDAAFPKGFLV